MTVVDKAINTEYFRSTIDCRCCFGLTVKDFLIFISQLLLPLVIGIFTVVITLDQRNENRIQRYEDRRLAEQQRQQDLNISRQQRLEDRELAKDQREQDLNISREQREVDKLIAEQQRLHDKQLAAEKREADDLNAAIQRNMTRDQRIYEINVEQDRYQKENEKYLDALLMSYYNEMGELLQKTNEKSLSSNSIIFSLARAKTLNVIEQIGPIRTVHLLMFLYDAGQLSVGENSLDLTEANLNGIDLRNQRGLINISLKGAHLNNASFVGQNLSYGNFRNAHLNHANFSGSICIGTIFDGARLIKADFSHTDIRNASFIQVDLRQATFYKTIGKNSHFKYARMQQTNFSDAHFDFIPFNTRGFIESNLAASDFRRAHLEQSQLVFCNMTQIDFSDANLRRANLTASLMPYASFDNTDLGGATLWATNLSYANLSNIQCSGTVGNISACYLRQSLTLENAQMPNRSFGLPSTTLLYGEGQPRCLSSVLGKFNACVFMPINVTNQVEMNQHVDLTPYYELVHGRRAKATIICLVGYDTRVIVTQYDENKEKLVSSESIQFRWSELLKPAAASLKLSIQFTNPLNYDHSWCQHVELHVEPDFKTPDTHLLHPWETN
ncbi:unnamed protein product [Rotaria sp. Silwood1]|nr:unnamed protein product [Rotaria sp. Silwood1]CAF3904086.1 unnamed protein product [Rotaria sp. Silwood1]CAF4992979.1 unnamed protein product [Rotaria sp. Silwood1]CAF5057951.1 unnamed protein product [Rotaria sp. Silwood1]